MASPGIEQLREDALTMLVLWATTQEYSADIESLLKQWANTFQISDAELMQRLTDATSGELQRPPDSRTGLGHSLELQEVTPSAAAAAAAAGASPFAPPATAGVGGSSKRQHSTDDKQTSSKRYKVTKTVPVIAEGDLPYINIGPAIGRRVLRYWPKDAGRNKGDPWFAAVVTDYEEDTGAHILTYQFGTQKEEKERVSLGMKRQDELRLTDEVIDLLEWYADPKKRRKSSAVEKSVYLRKQYQAIHGTGLAGSMGNKSKSKGGGKAHSNSALSSYST